MHTIKLSGSQKPRIASKMQDFHDIHAQYSQYLKMDDIAYDFMSKMGIRKEFYMLGGSAALVAYGINIGRVPHDIDLIVASGIYDAVIDIITNSPYYTKPSTDVPSSGHFAIEVRRGEETYILDILPHEMPIPFKACTPGQIYLQDLAQIKAVKDKWVRAKDLNDRTLIAKFLEQCTPQKNTSSDIPF